MNLYSNVLFIDLQLSAIACHLEFNNEHPGYNANFSNLYVTNIVTEKNNNCITQLEQQLGTMKDKSRKD